MNESSTTTTNTDVVSQIRRIISQCNNGKLSREKAAEFLAEIIVNTADLSIKRGDEVLKELITSGYPNIVYTGNNHQGGYLLEQSSAVYTGTATSCVIVAVCSPRGLLGVSHRNTLNKYFFTRLAYVSLTADPQRVQELSSQFARISENGIDLRATSEIIRRLMPLQHILEVVKSATIQARKEFEKICEIYGMARETEISVYAAGLSFANKDIITKAKNQLLKNLKLPGRPYLLVSTRFGEPLGLFLGKKPDNWVIASPPFITPGEIKGNLSLRQ